MRLPRLLFAALTILISAVWAANTVLGFVDPARHDPSLNAVFAVVLGGVYAIGGNHKALRWRLTIRSEGDDEESTSESRR